MRRAALLILLTAVAAAAAAAAKPAGLPAQFGADERIATRMLQEGGEWRRGAAIARLGARQCGRASCMRQGGAPHRQ